MPGDFLDLSSDPDPVPEKAPATPLKRPFLGVRFACCGVYVRVLLKAEQTTYFAHCPRCLGKLEIRIGPGGSEQRIFTAY